MSFIIFFKPFHVVISIFLSLFTKFFTMFGTILFFLFLDFINVLVVIVFLLFKSENFVLYIFFCYSGLLFYLCFGYYIYWPSFGSILCY